MRKNFRQEVCMLREALAMTKKQPHMQKQYRQALNVKLFNELDGLDPLLVEILNERILEAKVAGETALAIKERTIQE
jgi:hypothetical protein